MLEHRIKFTMKKTFENIARGKKQRPDSYDRYRYRVNRGELLGVPNPRGIVQPE